MDQIIIENRLLVRLNGGKISADFAELLRNNDVNCIKANDFIRIEHPDCAFFKSSHKTMDGVVQRKNLYTPEGRLHVDYKKLADGKLIKLDNYVKKDEHLEILLIYLRNLKITPSNVPCDDKQVLVMFESPLYELKSWIQEDIFNLLIINYEIAVKHVLYQLGRIYNIKLKILKDNLQSNIEYIFFPKTKIIKMNEQLFDKWHTSFVKKTRLFK